MAYQMLIDSAFQTTLENFHKIFQKFFKRRTHRVNWTVGCSDRTIRKANSKIFKNSQTAWTVQTGRKANSPKRPDRPKNWYCPSRLNSSDRANSPNSCSWFQNSGDSVLCFRFLGYHSPFGYRQIRYNSFLLFYPNQISTKHSCR